MQSSMLIEESRDQMDTPFLSVIVAVKNEEKCIKKCIESLLTQSFPQKDYQIIIVDGGSTDSTIRIVEEIIQKYPGRIHLLYNPKQWQSAGRNIGINLGPNSELIAYIDGHCIADSNWLESLYESYLESDSENLGGIGSIHYSPADETPLGKSIEQLFQSKLGGMGSSYMPAKQKQTVLTAPYVLYNRKALDTVGYYDEEMKIGEDFTLNYKLNKNNYKLFIEPKAIVYYYKKQSFKDFFKQMYNYGIAKAIIGKKYPKALRITHYLPSILFFLFLLFILSGLFIPSIQLITLILMLAYVSTILLYSLKISVQKKAGYFLLFMPVLYFIQHIAFSIGFYSGLLKKGWTL